MPNSQCHLGFYSDFCFRATCWYSEFAFSPQMLLASFASERYTGVGNSRSHLGFDTDFWPSTADRSRQIRNVTSDYIMTLAFDRLAGIAKLRVHLANFDSERFAGIANLRFRCACRFSNRTQGGVRAGPQGSSVIICVKIVSRTASKFSPRSRPFLVHQILIYSQTPDTPLHSAATRNFMFFWNRSRISFFLLLCCLF